MKALVYRASCWWSSLQFQWERGKRDGWDNGVRARHAEPKRETVGELHDAVKKYLR